MSERNDEEIISELLRVAKQRGYNRPQEVQKVRDEGARAFNEGKKSWECPLKGEEAKSWLEGYFEKEKLSQQNRENH